MSNQLAEMRRDHEMLEKSIRGDSYRSIIEEASSINRLFVDHPDLAELWGSIRYVCSREDPTEVQKSWIITMLIDFYENVNFQHEQGNIPDTIWESWKLHIINVFSDVKVKEQWTNAKGIYYKSFRDFIDGALIGS